MRLISSASNKSQVVSVSASPSFTSLMAKGNLSRSGSEVTRAELGNNSNNSGTSGSFVGLMSNETHVQRSRANSLVKHC